MTKTFRVSDVDIKRACSYITEDKAIADYFHVDIARVTELRKKTSNKDAAKAERAQNSAPVPLTAEDQRIRRDAKQGSDDLLRALARYLQNRKAA
jgi:hypothetical protein|tara:strand:- start:520 stop:804 length:285 start_codon:yes stop_codon:yes gene_type:complete